MTSIEWLFEEIKHIIPNDFLHKYEEAKKMHHKEIIDTCKNFGNLNGVDIEDYEQYYNETFKK